MMRVWKSLLWHLKEGYVYAALQRTCATRCGTQVSDKSTRIQSQMDKQSSERESERVEKRKMGEVREGTD